MAGDMKDSYRRLVEPRRFELIPEAAPHVSVHLADDRQTASADDDLIEIGIHSQRDGGVGIAVTLTVDEIARLREALTAIIETEPP